MQNKTKFIENLCLIIIFLYVMIIIAFPLINNGCILGHDIGYHLLRIESLKNGIQIGKPLLKINTLFFNNAGYASSLFYPDLMLYFPALLRVLGFSIATSYHLLLMLSTILCYASVYYCTKLITKNKYSAVIASIVYTLCQYHIDDIYVRSAIGEITAFIFIPLIFFGIYDVLYDNFQKPWIMIVGFVGVMLCHTSTLIICLLLYFLFFTVHIKTFIQKPALLCKLLLTAVFVLLITAFYWLPVVEQMLDGKFGYNVQWVFASEMAVNIGTLFSIEFTGMGLFYFMLPKIIYSQDRRK